MYRNADPRADIQQVTGMFKSLLKQTPGLAPAPQPFTFSPLFIRKADTVISWSPKSGCSHVALWAFVHEGFLAEASGEKELPHRFRIHVYQKQPAFKAQVRRLRRENGAGQTLLKVTRDPRKRLVSIFRHACRFPFLHPAVRERLGFDPGVEGLSLTDLDAVLGALRLAPPTTANPHVRGQYTPLWDLGFDRVITLNMDEIPLNASLAAVERSLGLPLTNFAGIPAFQRLREIHYARPRGFAMDGAVETYRFKPHETKAFPKHQLLASPLLESMARRHYRLDYAGVGSGDTAGELFQPEERAAAALLSRVGVPGQLPGWPPVELQKKYTGSHGIALMKSTLRFVEALDRAGAFANPEWRGLDYGCGWGRIASVLLTKGGPHQLDLCDAWPQAVELLVTAGFANRVFPVPELLQGDNLDREAYDFIYAFSVFTHLRRDAFENNLQRLFRALKPSGKLYITIRHADYMSHIKTGHADRDILSREGFWYRSTGHSAVFGIAITERAYIERLPVPGSLEYLGEVDSCQHLYAFSA